MPTRRNTTTAARLTARTPPPPHLDPDAAREWRRILRAMHAEGHPLDRIEPLALALYCLAWSDLGRYTRIEKAEGLIVTTATGRKAAHPVVALVDSASRRLLRYGKRIGATPAARAKMRRA